MALTQGFSVLILKGELNAEQAVSWEDYNPATLRTHVATTSSSLQHHRGPIEIRHQGG